MPLEILAPLVVVGIAGIALLLHLSGHSAVAPLSRARAQREWNGHYPDTPADSIRLSDDALAALVGTAAGPGLLWVFGADTTARLFHNPPDIHVTSGGLAITTGDFTAPRITIALRDDADKAAWSDALRMSSDRTAA